MGRFKDEQRANRERKIKQRKNLINSIRGAWRETTMPFCERMEIKDGYLSNNNEVNRWSHADVLKRPKQNMVMHLTATKALMDQPLNEMPMINGKLTL